MEPRRQPQQKQYSPTDQLFNLRPYRKYLNTLKDKDKKVHLPINGGLSKMEYKSYKEMIDSDMT